MKQFIKKVCFFLCPVILFVVPAGFFYKADKGDLMRMSYQYYLDDYDRV